MIDPTAAHPLLRELNDAIAIEGAELREFLQERGHENLAYCIA